MAGLHLTKVAVGCGTIDILAHRLASRAAGGETFITTRFCPKRADELMGGSLFWIIKHRLVARQRIIAFVRDEGVKGEGEGSAAPHTLIRLDAALVPVTPRPRRAHQGWRYLETGDAPADLGTASGGLDTLPQSLLDELANLALV